MNTESVTLLSDDTKKQSASLHWRRESIRSLYQKGFDKPASHLKNCGCSFRVRVCPTDLNHQPKAVPITCGLSFCPECAARESYRKLSRYLPALEALLTPNPEYPDHFLFKMCLTTPYDLYTLTSEKFKNKQKLINDFLSVYFFWYFHEKGELSKKEIRSGRCNLKQHGIGALVSAEFGEKTKHLHWHFLIYAPFMPFDDIKAVWQDVTGGECLVVDVSGIKARQTYDLKDGGDIIGAVQEIVKYATKFTTLKPRDVPKLYSVLKGNRRFRSFGILYDIDLAEESEMPNTCEECGAEHQLFTVGQYVTACMNRDVPLSDEVADAIEEGIRIYLTRDYEISSGNRKFSTKKARDALESDSR